MELVDNVRYHKFGELEGVCRDIYVIRGVLYRIFQITCVNRRQFGEFLTIAKSETMGRSVSDNLSEECRTSASSFSCNLIKIYPRSHSQLIL